MFFFVTYETIHLNIGFYISYLWRHTLFFSTNFTGADAMLCASWQAGPDTALFYIC